MKKMKRTWFLRAVVTLLAGVFLFSCSLSGENAGGTAAERVSFTQDRITLEVGRQVSAGIVIQPAGAKGNAVRYSATMPGIVELSSGSNSGVVIKGISPGSVVVTAQVDGVTGYLEVTVEGDISVNHPYIAVPNPVIEIPEGGRKSVSVSLYGGTVLDNNGFIWSLENGKNNITIETTANTVVVNGMERGHQKITISHPKAEFNCELLVFVTGKDGSAVVRVRHPKSPVDLDVRILVVEGAVPYISLDKSFIILSKGQGGEIRAEIDGDAPRSWYGDFSYELDNPAIAQVQQASNTFFVHGLADGTAVLTIKNVHLASTTRTGLIFFLILNLP